MKTCWMDKQRRRRNRMSVRSAPKRIRRRSRSRVPRRTRSVKSNWTCDMQCLPHCSSLQRKLSTMIGPLWSTILALRSSSSRWCCKRCWAAVEADRSANRHTECAKLESEVSYASLLANAVATAATVGQMLAVAEANGQEGTGAAGAQ